MEQRSDYGAVGNRNLEIVHQQSRFTQWMYDQIRPHIRGHVLEIGSGVGTYSRYLIRHDPGVVLSELDPGYVKQLRKRFPKNDVLAFDMSSPKSVAGVRKRHKFDTIIFLNVLEHVREDRRALRLLRSLLRKDGRIICLVPTHKFLYNCIDESIGHCRRYTKDELRSKVERAGYTVESLFSFNAFAIPGWYLNGNLLKQRIVNPSAMRLFNAIVPAFRVIERYVLFRSVGISTIIVARRK
jgi:SAM-dependent methyltransferase